MGELLTSNIDLSPPQSAEDRLAQMRSAFEQIIAQRPCALILMADVSIPGHDAVVVSATGSPIDVKVLHAEGTKALAAMMLRADEEASAERPALNG
jgi:hypothetical protein